MERENKAHWWKYDSNLSEKQIRIGNRVYGLLGLEIISMALIATGGSSVLANTLALPMIAEFGCDLVTGEHHYLSSKLLRKIGFE